VEAIRCDPGTADSGGAPTSGPAKISNQSERAGPEAGAPCAGDAVGV